MTDDLLEEQLSTVPEGFRRMEWFQGFGRQMGPLYQKDMPDGRYVRAFHVCDHHTNGMGNCHGGMLMAFADTAFGQVVSIRYNQYWVTVRLLTDFVSAAKRGEWVEGSAEITGCEDGLVSVVGEVRAEGRTVLTGSGVFKLLGPRPQRRAP